MWLACVPDARHHNPGTRSITNKNATIHHLACDETANELPDLHTLTAASLPNNMAQHCKRPPHDLREEERRII